MQDILLVCTLAWPQRLEQSVAQCYLVVDDVPWAGWDGQAMVAVVQNGEHSACPCDLWWPGLGTRSFHVVQLSLKLVTLLPQPASTGMTDVFHHSNSALWLLV